MFKTLALFFGFGALALGWPASSLAAPTVHHGRGVLRGFQDHGRVLVIEHQAIPGFMGAMTMPFELAQPSLARGLRVGDRVDFTLSHRGDFWPITAIHRVIVKRRARHVARPQTTPTVPAASAGTSHD